MVERKTEPTAEPLKTKITHKSKSIFLNKLLNYLIIFFLKKGDARGSQHSGQGHDLVLSAAAARQSNHPFGLKSRFIVAQHRIWTNI